MDKYDSFGKSAKILYSRGFLIRGKLSDVREDGKSDSLGNPVSSKKRGPYVDEGNLSLEIVASVRDSEVKDVNLPRTTLHDILSISNVLNSVREDSILISCRPLLRSALRLVIDVIWVIQERLTGTLPEQILRVNGRNLVTLAGSSPDTSLLLYILEIIIVLGEDNGRRVIPLRNRPQIEIV